MVDEDSGNHISHGGVQFPWQEMVNEDLVNHISDKVDLSGQEMVHEDAESSDVPKNGGVCRGKTHRTPREMYPPLMQGKM